VRRDAIDVLVDANGIEAGSFVYVCRHWVLQKNAMDITVLVEGIE
jgi:hypothetical protein